MGLGREVWWKESLGAFMQSLTTAAWALLLYSLNLLPLRHHYPVSRKGSREAAVPLVDVPCFAGQTLIFKMPLYKHCFLAPKAKSL